MTQTVYVDILVIINIYIGYILLSTAGYISGSHASPLRLLASSLLQGAGSLVIFLPRLSVWLNIPVRVAMCALFILVAYGYHGKRPFLRACLAFLGVGMGFAGAMSALWFFLSPGGMAYNNGTVYFNIDALTLAVMTVACYAVTRLVLLLIKRKSAPEKAYILQVAAFGRLVSCAAIEDTGNILTDYLTGLPVIVVSKSVAAQLLGDMLTEALNAADCLTKLPSGFRLIPCGTVCGDGILVAFRPESVSLRGVASAHTSTQVLVAFSGEGFGDTQAEALIGGNFFRNSEEVVFSVGKEKNHFKAEFSTKEADKASRRRGVLCKRFGKPAGAVDRK